MLSVYLAGPDVFRDTEDMEEAVSKIKASLMFRGMEGRSPMDNGIQDFKNNIDTAKQIYVKNVELIKKCDIILANLESFRGPSADVGTVWEIGYGLGLGKTVIGYRPSNTFYKDKDMDVNDKYPKIEDFGLSDNLMIDCSIPIFDSYENAIAYLYTYNIHNEMNDIIKKDTNETSYD